MNTEQPTPQRKKGQRAWTDAQRAQQARKIYEQQIWLKSTGPRTPQGKRISARNSYKNGRYSFEKKVLRWYLKLCVMRHKKLNCRVAYDDYIYKNELIDKYGLPNPKKPDVRAFHRFFKVSPLSPDYKKHRKRDNLRNEHEVFDYLTTLSELKAKNAENGLHKPV